ncbi:hypothetical protein BC828DRAFT_38939, partial [Blastocladiella britannica]
MASTRTALFDCCTLFAASPPMALHLVSLIGLAGYGWVMGDIADNGSADGYALEMCAAMLNFGYVQDERLDEMRADIANGFLAIAVPESSGPWIKRAVNSAQISNRIGDNPASLDPELYLSVGDIGNPYERLIVPLGGLFWIMAHVRSNDWHISLFGAQLLQRVIVRYLRKSLVILELALDLFKRFVLPPHRKG